MLHVFRLKETWQRGIAQKAYDKSPYDIFYCLVLNWAIVAVLSVRFISSLFFVHKQFLVSTISALFFFICLAVHKHKEWMSDKMWKQWKLMPETSRCFLIQRNLITWSGWCLGKVKESLRATFDVWFFKWSCCRWSGDLLKEISQLINGE